MIKDTKDSNNILTSMKKVNENIKMGRIEYINIEYRNIKYKNKETKTMEAWW